MTVITDICIGYVSDYNLNYNALDNVNADPEYYVARLSECPTIKDKSVKVNLELLGVADSVNDLIEIKTKVISKFGIIFAGDETASCEQYFTIK